MAERADCRVVRSADTGHAGGINRGVREAVAAEAVLILNPDVHLLPGSAMQPSGRCPEWMVISYIVRNATQQCVTSPD